MSGRAPLNAWGERVGQGVDNKLQLIKVNLCCFLALKYPFLRVKSDV